MIIRFDDTGNAAFGGDFREHEVATILRDIANRVESGHTTGFIKDSNGNKVGKWAMKEKKRGR